MLGIRLEISHALERSLGFEHLLESIYRSLQEKKDQKQHLLLICQMTRPKNIWCQENVKVLKISRQLCWDIFNSQIRSVFDTYKTPLQRQTDWFPSNVQFLLLLTNVFRKNMQQRTQYSSSSKNKHINNICVWESDFIQIPGFYSGKMYKTWWL